MVRRTGRQSFEQVAEQKVQKNWGVVLLGGNSAHISVLFRLNIHSPFGHECGRD